MKMESNLTSDSRALLPHTSRRALSMLSQLKAIECRLNDQSVTMTNHYDEEVARIFEALEVTKPAKIIQNQSIRLFVVTKAKKQPNDSNMLFGSCQTRIYWMLNPSHFAYQAW